MPNKQYHKLGCLDVDPKGGCAFEVRAETEEECLRVASEHNKVVHHITAMPPEIASKVRSAMKTVPINL